MTQGFFVWSKTASANSNSDSSINWAEGQAPSSVNDSARAMEARLAEYRDDTAGSLLTAGTGTAYTVATNENFTTLALMSGQSLRLRFHAVNGAAATLAVDGLTAQPLQVASGTAAVQAGVIGANTIWDVTYDNSIPAFILTACPGQIWAVAAGTADAITATYPGTISTLVDGQEARFRATAANATATPTFAPNALTAHTITKKGGSALLIGDIPGNLAEVILRYNLANTRWELLNPAVTVLGTNQIPAGVTMLNGTIVATKSANAQTFAIKTLAAADPSAGDPVFIMFRATNPALGGYNVITVSAALSITIPSSQGIGFVNATPGRVWIGALNNAGTAELFVYNALGTATTNPCIFPLQGFGIISTSAVAGAGSAGVGYSTTARSNVAYVPLGYAAWEMGGTLGTAGTWNVDPTRLSLYQSGSVPLPGQPIQMQRNDTGAMATGTTTVTFNNSTPQNTAGDQYMSQAITPTSSANLLMVEHQGQYSGAVGFQAAALLCQDSTANALAIATENIPANGARVQVQIKKMLQAATLSATTFKVRAGPSGASTLTFNGSLGVAEFNGIYNSFLEVQEIMS